MKIVFGLLLAGILSFGVTPAFVSEAKADNKKINTTVQPVKETPHAYEGEHRPEDEQYFCSNQYISMSHIGDISKVWNNYRGDGVKVAVIDGGIHKAHEDFWKDSNCSISDESAAFYTDGTVYTVKDNGWDCINADWSDDKDTLSARLHGIATSATLMATATGCGTVGIAPNATLMFLKTDFWSNSSMDAVRYAVDHGAQVISMSFGGTGGASSYQYALDYAYEHGVICVASAGNENYTVDTYPASANHVVGVGALARNSSTERASYSNTNGHLSPTGHNVDCMAPGTVYTATDCWSQGESNYREVNGTSFSCPIVAGAATLFKQKYPTANQDVFEEALRKSCVNIGDEYTFGWGRLDVGALMEVLDEDEELDYEKTNYTTKNQDATIIKWTDEAGWLFRTLHIYNMGFADGYTARDFNNYLRIEYGERTDRTSYSFEGTTKSWSYTTAVSVGDYLINTGSDAGTYQVVLPWWVIAGTYQFVNNNNWVKDDKCYIWKDDAHYKSTITSTVKAPDGNVYSTTDNPEPGATYDFRAISISRVLVNPDLTVIKTLDTYLSCMYDIIKGNMLTNEAAVISGKTTSRWYEDSECTTPFNNQILRRNKTLYAICYEANTSIYFESMDWGDNNYVYEYYTDSNGLIYEPLGSWPGTNMAVIDGTSFLGHGVWYGKVYSAQGITPKIIFTNGNGGYYDQTEDLDLVADGYYYESEGSEVYTTKYKDALELIIDIRNAMKDVTASGSIKDDSVCGLSGSSVNSFVLRYNALTGDAKTAFDSATIWTYKSVTDDKENVSYGALMNQISMLGNGNNSRVVIENSTLGITLIISAVAFMLVVGLVVVLRFKEKKQY